MLGLVSCTNDVKEVEALFDTPDFSAEVARDVTLFYSDSAIVQVKIQAPTMIRKLENATTLEEFPDGLVVNFYNDNGSESAWLEADYAIRNEKEKKFYIKENVIVYNKNNDKMRTIDLVWDEGAKEMATDKAVIIMQPSVGDTLFGYGVIANEDFSRFEVKRKVSAIKKWEKLVEGLDN